MWRRVIFAAATAIMLNSSGAHLEAAEPDWDAQRDRLVQSLRRAGGINDEAVLAAIGKVPRHLFVPGGQQFHAYDDEALPIGEGQTISQPYVVAYMTEALKLKPTDRVLEIGTGSGYHAAVMSLVAKKVFTIEIIPKLGNQAARLLDSLGYDNVEVRIGDGYKGWLEAAPFEAVILTAAPAEIPQPLLDQLAIGGRLIAPVGRGVQQLILVERTQQGYTRRALLPVMFVPMTGEAQK